MFTCAVVGYNHQVGVKRNETALNKKAEKLLGVFCVWQRL